MSRKKRPKRKRKTLIYRQFRGKFNEVELEPESRTQTQSQERHEELVKLLGNKCSEKLDEPDEGKLWKRGKTWKDLGSAAAS